MPIATRHVSVSKPISSPERKSPAQKSSTAVFKAKSGSAGRAALSKSSIISPEQLNKLALDLKNKVIDREEANRRFVATVIDNSLRNKLGEQDREKLMMDIKEFFSNDQSFIDKLTKNLHDLV
ncbi:MAG: hypothetical protein KC505_02895 [Myxococcales bacterium]|nr:hypothetical protein [Myxococcales bacterium]USN51708.1 MAG: hypothetical protein H6731_04680 [Myxococcales bacterium]